MSDDDWFDDWGEMKVEATMNVEGAEIPYDEYNKRVKDINGLLAEVKHLLTFHRVGEATLAVGQVSYKLKELNQLIADRQFDRL